MILEEYDEEKQRRLDRRDAKAEGKTEGMAEAVLELLEDLGPVPESIIQMIRSEKSTDKMKKYLKASARCSSFDDFEKKISGQ